MEPLSRSDRSCHVRHPITWHEINIELGNEERWQDITESEGATDCWSITGDGPADAHVASHVPTQ